MPKGQNRSTPLFFEEFRTALASAPSGLIQAAPPASGSDIATAEARLGRPLPPAYAEFLRSFDGAELFHESVVLFGVGPETFRNVADENPAPSPELFFAEASSGDRFFLVDTNEGENAVIRIRGGSDERWVSGSNFPAWLSALLAHELLLYDSEGEFVLDAFEVDGEELVPNFALRQAERAVKRDPGSAESHHEMGIAYRRLDRLDRARESFRRAASLDPTNPWPWFDLGRLDLETGDHASAIASFGQAAKTLPGPEGARFLAWAARAAYESGNRVEWASIVKDALLRDPELPATLERAAIAAEAEDPAALEEALALATPFTPGAMPKKRLPILSGAAASPAPTKEGRRTKRTLPRR